MDIALGTRTAETTALYFEKTSSSPSIRVLEKNGFTLMEEFTEDGILSRYYQISL